MNGWVGRLRHVATPARPTNAVDQPLLDATRLVELAEQGRRLAAETAADREVQQRRAGDRLSVHRGVGLDFDDSRPYQPGDDLRYMNWRLSARAGEPYMKVFREEHRAGAFLVVDRRATMRFGTRVRLKATQAAQLAALVAFAATERGLAVGGVMLEPAPRWIPEQAGTGGALEIARAAGAPCPPLRDSAEAPALGHMLRLLAPQLPLGTELTLISDFMDLTEDDRGPLLQLAQRHRLRALQVLDAAELTLPRAGLVRLEDPVTAQARTVDSSAATTRRSFAAAATAHWQTRASILDRAGVPWRRVHADADAFAALLEPWP